MIAHIIAIILSISSLNEAYETYRIGEETIKPQAREEAFNTALNLYREIPSGSSGKVDYNIGNTYFQLGAYPWAVYHYYHALALRPRDEKVRSNMSLALEKLNLPKINDITPYHQVLYFHYFLSVPERKFLFFLLTSLLLIMLSMRIWGEFIWLRYPIIIVTICSCLLLSSLLYTQFFAPIEGVLIRSSPLRIDAGNQYALSKENPLPAGTRVQVLYVSKDQQWIKVTTPSGELGYISHQNMRL